MRRVKINLINGNFWFNPTLITTSKRLWSPRPYKSLKKLLVTEKLWDEDLIIDINKDTELKIFRQLLQFKDNPFAIKNDDLITIEKNGFVDIKLKKSKIFLRFDKKSLTFLKKGIIPFFQYYYLKTLRPKGLSSSEHYYLLWRKDGFVEMTKKLKLKLEKKQRSNKWMKN